MPIRWAAFSEDGRRLVTASPDRCVLLWDVASLAVVKAVPGGWAAWIDGKGASSPNAGRPASMPASACPPVTAATPDPYRAPLLLTQPCSNSSAPLLVLQWRRAAASAALPPPQTSPGPSSASGTPRWLWWTCRQAALAFFWVPRQQAASGLVCGWQRLQRCWQGQKNCKAPASACLEHAGLPFTTLPAFLPLCLPAAADWGALVHAAEMGRARQRHWPHLWCARLPGPLPACLPACLPGCLACPPAFAPACSRSLHAHPQYTLLCRRSSPMLPSPYPPVLLLLQP